MKTILDESMFLRLGIFIFIIMIYAELKEIKKETKIIRNIQMEKVYEASKKYG